MIDRKITVGQVEHKLSVGAVDQLEIYDYPGGYAKRFDGTPDKIFPDGKRTANIRIQGEECNTVVMEGEGTCRQFTSGHKFELERHFSDNGEYVLVSVSHSCRQDLQFRSYGIEQEDTINYSNQFTCIPRAMPFRPPRTAVRPIVHGTQTAVVTGPAGEEIYTDQYGRIKVQFHWDRAGKGDEESSCWVRVATPWAGKGWGMFTLPRIGQEVVIDFLEGDPDRPLVVGSVYNADHIHAYELPAEQTKSYWKSMSSKGGKGFNEFRLEDKKGSEQVFLHGEKDLEIRIKNDRKEWIGRDRHLIVKRDKFEHIERDSHVDIKRDSIAKIGRDHHLEIAGKEAIKVTGSLSMAVQGDVIEQFKANHSCEVTQNIYLKGMQVVIEASTGITLKVGGNFITIDPSGVAVKGTLIQLNSAGLALSGTAGSLVSPLSPTQALEAVKADPGALAAPLARKTMAPAPLSLQQLAPIVRRTPASDAPTHDPNAEDNREKKSWIEIELLDEAGQPVPGEAYRITLPDGTTVAEGTTDEKGRARVDHIDPGTCKVTFPNLDKDAWEPK
jgi:type VI secretion system secreted protein VgrG